jgi:hypothetical protein
VNYQIQREDISEVFADFIGAVQSMYGVGAMVILMGLATTLSEKFDLKEDFNYQDLDERQLMMIYRECQGKYAGKSS